MTSQKQKLAHQTWKKDNYYISTDPALVPLSELNEVFASDLVYWATALPEPILRETLQNSLCFGLYELAPTEEEEEDSSHTSSPDQQSGNNGRFIGFARCITDFTTFVYLTDVYVDGACQGKGLGKWLVGCVREAIEAMPYLRRSLLFTGDWERSVPFYEREMGMSVMECKEGEGVAIMQRKGPAFPASLQ